MGANVDGGTNLPLISDYNRGVVLECIRTSDHISRVEIAELTGLSRASVTNIVRRLLDDGLVSDVGPAKSTGGKPRRQLTFNDNARYTVGVLLDADSIRYVITNLAGAAVPHEPLPSHLVETVGDHNPERPSPQYGVQQFTAEDDTPTTVLARIAETVRALVTAAGVQLEDVLGVGVAAPGPLHYDRGVLVRPPNLGDWVNVAVRDELECLLELPVIVDNDATAAVLGELWQTDAGELKCFACLYMSNGIGAGLILNGTVYRGASSNAGEIGHLPIRPGGARCTCGRRGCLDAYSSPRGIANRIREQLEPAELRRLGLPRRSKSATSEFDQLKQAASLGDELAQRLLQDAALDLSSAALALVNLLDLELIVLTGEGFIGAEDVFVAAITEMLRDNAFPTEVHSCQVRMSPIAANAGAIGAASLIMHKVFSPQIVGLRSASR